MSDPRQLALSCSSWSARAAPPSSRPDISPHAGKLQRNPAGYYAQPFTPEAKKARQYEQDFGSPGGSRSKTGYTRAARVAV